MAFRDPTFKIVTVFGGTGFLGRHVIERLARRGWRVRVPTRDPSRALFLKPMGDIGQIVPVFANIRDDATVRTAIDGADYVINLVGILYEASRKASFENLHVHGPRRIADLSKQCGIDRLIHMSAIGADPASDAEYGRTKAAGESAVREAFPDATIFRPSIVFGPEDGFFNLFAGMARISPVLPLIGGGHTRFQPVYVGDVADAMLASLERPDSKGRTYELGGPKVYSFKELMQLMLSVTQQRVFLVPVPWNVAMAQGAVLGMLPKPPLTRDQVRMLRQDNVVSGQHPGFRDLGLTPTAPEAILPSYLEAYRPGGKFSRMRRQAG